METEITATELSKNLGRILDRVVRNQETFVVTRRGKPIVKLNPAPKVATLGDLVALWARFRPDDKFADDLEEIQRNQQMLLPDRPSPWDEP